MVKFGMQEQAYRSPLLILLLLLLVLVRGCHQPIHKQ